MYACCRQKHALARYKNLIASSKNQPCDTDCIYQTQCHIHGKGKDKMINSCLNHFTLVDGKKIKTCIYCCKNTLNNQN